MEFCNYDISKTITARSSKQKKRVDYLVKILKKSVIALGKFEHRKLDISKTLTARSFEQT